MGLTCKMFNDQEGCAEIQRGGNGQNGDGSWPPTDGRGCPVCGAINGGGHGGGCPNVGRQYDSGGTQQALHSCVPAGPATRPVWIVDTRHGCVHFGFPGRTLACGFVHKQPIRRAAECFNQAGQYSRGHPPGTVFHFRHGVQRYTSQLGQLLPGNHPDTTQAGHLLAIHRNTPPAGHQLIPPQPMPEAVPVDLRPQLVKRRTLS